MRVICKSHKHKQWNTENIKCSNWGILLFHKTILAQFEFDGSNTSFFFFKKKKEKKKVRTGPCLPLSSIPSCFNNNLQTYENWGELLLDVGERNGRGISSPILISWRTVACSTVLEFHCHFHFHFVSLHFKWALALRRQSFWITFIWFFFPICVNFNVITIFSTTFSSRPLLAPSKLFWDLLLTPNWKWENKSQFKHFMFSMFHCEWNMGLWDLQINAFCFGFFVTQHPIHFLNWCSFSNRSASLMSQPLVCNKCIFGSDHSI